MMASQNHKLQVYLACQGIFHGDSANVRKLAKIKQRVSTHQRSLQPLINKLGGDEKFFEILRDLLEGGVFASESRRKLEFPEIHPSSPSHDISHSAFKGVPEASEKIIPAGAGDGGPERPGEPGTTLVPSGAAQRQQKPGVPSLFPWHVPFKAQHLILTTAQQVLEECCFDFAKDCLPAMVKENGWDCAAAVELNQWTKILDAHHDKLALYALDPGSSSIQGVFASIARLRHTAVHRAPIPAEELRQLVESAVKFAQLLQDRRRALQLQRLTSEVNAKINAMELSKKFLEDKTTRQLQEIQRQREELDRMEKAAIEDMLQVDSGNKAIIGNVLEQAVRNIFTDKRDQESAVVRDTNSEEVGGRPDGERALITWDVGTGGG